MAENKKKPMPKADDSAKKADLSARLEAATGNIDRVSQDTVARRTEQKENMKKSARDARARARGSEKQRIADEARAGEITRHRIAELEYAEDYRKKLQKERNRNREELRRAREAAALEARAERSKEIQAQLEEERNIAMERAARAEALLGKIAAKNAEIKDAEQENPADSAVEYGQPKAEEDYVEEVAAPATENSIDETDAEEPFEEPFEEENPEYSMDDKVVIDILDGEGYTVDIDMNDGIHSFEVCAPEAEEITEADAAEEKEVVEEKVVGEYPDPKLSSNPVVAAIQTLGKSVYTTSGYRKYLDKSRSTIKEFKRVIANLEQSVSLGSDEDGAATLAIVNAINAAGAIVEIRCDNLRLAVKYGQRNVEATKKELSADIEFYNSKVAEFATFTGEKLTRLSPSLTARIAEGSGVEVIPELTFGERYIEYNGEYNGERTRSYVINLGTEPPEITEEQKSNVAGTYMVKPVIPATTAEKLLDGVHVTDAVAYTLYRKTAIKAGKYIEKLISKVGYDVDIAEENGEKYTKRLERQRLSVNKLVDRLKNKVDDAKDTAYRKTLAALEGKRGAYDKTEKKLELTRTYAEDKERLSALKINRLALRREKLIIAFNTLSAASITGHDEYIEKAKAELLSEMVAYNTAAEECSALIGIKVTPILAALADDILEGKSCVDIPRIAVLKELKETVGESTRLIGKQVETAAQASCTFIISGGRGGSPEVKKPKSNLRTVHGNFFIGNSAYNGVAGNGSSDYADALVTGAVVAGPMMAASGAEIDPGVAAATALAFGTAATAGGNGVLNALSSANQTGGGKEADAPIIEEAAAENAVYAKTVEAAAAAEVISANEGLSEVKEAPVAEATPVSEAAPVSEAKANTPDNSEFSFVPGVFGFEGNEITDPIEEAPVIEETPVIEKAAEVEKASLEAEAQPEESPFIINEVRDEPAELDAAEEAVAEDAPIEELNAPIEEVSPRRLRKTLRDERGEETVVEEPYTEALINDDREEAIAPAAQAQSDYVDEPVDITGEDINSDKIKLVQLPPPEGMGDGAELPEEEEEAGPVYPGNTIRHPDDGFDYEDPDDLSSMPPVIEIDDSADLVDNEMLFKPTKRGFKKYANYVHKKISQAKRQRNVLLRKKRSEKSVVPKVKLIISILGCQKDVIDWSCNLLSACCDMGKKKLSKRVANALRKEIKRYNKYVKEYEKLTDDRLTKASLDIPACILEGEDYQTLPKVKLREFEAPEDGVVFDDGITEIADVENDYEGVTVMTAKELKHRLQTSSAEIDRLHAQLDRKVKEKHDAWGIERSILTAECFGIQKNIIDTLATDLHAACQSSAVKSVQNLKKALNYEVRQYNRLVSEYRTVSGNILTPASTNIAQDIIAGNNYAPVPRVGCVHSTADELSADIANMSRNSYGVETDELGVAGRAAFRSKVNAQANKDLTLVTKRADYETSMLESERDMLDYRFGKEPSQVRREKRDIAKRIDKVRSIYKQALKYENADNRRYYAVVNANPRTMVLNNKRADRTRIAAVRSKIISLLNERDAVNGKLAALYAGGDDLVSGSVNQSMRRIKNKAAEKAKKKQKALAKIVKDLPITQSDKNRFYTLMNKKVDALSTLALVKHRLKKEKLHSDDKLVARRDIKELSARAKAIEKDICDLMNTTKKRISEIESGHSWMIAFFFVILLMIVGVALYIHFFGDSISSMLNMFGS